MAINKLKKRIFQELSYKTGKYLIPPEIISLVVTYRCNFKCKACTVWRMDDFPELPQDEWMKISENLRSILSPNTAVEISGGEPLIRKEMVIFKVGLILLKNNLKLYRSNLKTQMLMNLIRFRFKMILIHL